MDCHYKSIYDIFITSPPGDWVFRYLGSSALWGDVEDFVDVLVNLAWGTNVLHRLDVSILSCPGFFSPSLVLTHSGGLDKPTRSSGVLGEIEAGLRETNSFLGSAVTPAAWPGWTAGATLWSAALGDRVRWTWEIWSVLIGDSVVVEPVARSAPWLTDRVLSRMDNSESTLTFIYSLSESCKGGEGSSLWSLTLLSLSSWVTESCLLTLGCSAAPVESSVRCRGSMAGPGEGAGDVDGVVEVERLRVAIVIEVRAWRFVLRRETPSLAAISRTWVSKSGQWVFSNCTLESGVSVVRPCSGWFTALRVVNLSAGWGRSCLLGTLTLDVTLLSVSVLSWLWKEKIKITVGVKVQNKSTTNIHMKTFHHCKQLRNQFVNRSD